VVVGAIVDTDCASVSIGESTPFRTATYLEVLDGQRSLFAAELTLAEARGNEYQSLVQLYRALGGGWQT